MRRVLAATVGAWLAAWAVFLAVPALAQTGTTIAISTRAAEVSDVLQRGQQLETERRWGDALTHYEDAIRQYPERLRPAAPLRVDAAALRPRPPLRRPQLLPRRSATCPSSKALELYAQVLLKIQAHYVDAPHWKRLGRRGAATASRSRWASRRSSSRTCRRANGSAIEDFCREVRKAIAARDRSTAAPTPARPWPRPPGWRSSGWKSAPRPSCSNTCAARPTRSIPIPPT